MSIAETLKILPRDLSGTLYAGKPLRKSDIVSIDPSIKRVVFRMPVEIKAMSAASMTDVILLKPSRITHLMISGRLISTNSLFCGSIECGGDVIIKGDLSTWLGDVETLFGNICITGDLVSAGRVRAKNGFVIINGELEAEDFPEAKVFWEGAQGAPLPVSARPIALNASQIIKSCS